MNHAGVTSGCTNCHANGKSFFGVSIVTQPTTHIPIGAAACEDCHSTATFTSFGGTKMNHAPIAGTPCATCHASGKTFYGVTIVTPPAAHLPFGTAGCDSCHAPAGFTSFGGAAMNHSVVGGAACASCHETGKSFYGVTIVTRPTPAQDPNHPTVRRLRHVPRVHHVVRDRRHREAGQPHSDHASVHAVPHDAGQLFGRHDEPRGHQAADAGPATPAA